MKYIKIKIVEFRDSAAYAVLQQADADLRELMAAADAAKREAAEIEHLAKESQAPADLEKAESAKARARALASSIITAREKVGIVSEAHGKKAKAHKMVGTFGYQEVDPARMEVVRLLDEAGNPFPADAVFGYEVVDAEPPMPTWGIPDPPREPDPLSGLGEAAAAKHLP